MAELKNDPPKPTELDGIKDIQALKDKGMPEWLAPILSAASSMGGSYMLWIKPLQDKMDALTKQVADLQEQVEELQEQNEDYEAELKTLSGQVENNLSGMTYLPTKKPNGQATYQMRRI